MFRLRALASRDNTRECHERLISFGGSNRVFFCFASNISKTSTLWATLPFRIWNISFPFTPRTDHHVIFLRLKNLLAHFLPDLKFLLCPFSFLSIHQGIRLGQEFIDRDKIFRIEFSSSYANRQLILFGRLGVVIFHVFI